ncbi:MAG: hypothetical protein DME03_13140 [Candidatus Rokuibacteriota bacterium]|nr:MAG: hypothetical protein DME03_13140 [Candidatus Rokubacteria bacterium]
MRRPAWALLAATIVLALAGSSPLEAQSFFAGKTVRIVVGLAPGGGFDTYARLLARHLGRHIPGNPAIIVENMTGAGGLISANHLYRVVKPDGLSLAHVPGTLLLREDSGQDRCGLARRADRQLAANPEGRARASDPGRHGLQGDRRDPPRRRGR